MGAEKAVKITCKGVAYDAIDNFVWFQGDLKVLPEANYEKLKRLILRLGFCVPLGIWLRDNELVLVDGHQRILTLKRMRDEGFVIPMIPYFPVEAKDINDAKEKVLSMASQFGVVTDTGLLTFVADSNIKISKLDDHYVMPGVDLKEISKIDLPPPGKEVQVSAHTRQIDVTSEDSDVQRLVATTESKVKRGDLWILGDHRLLCGDSTQVGDLERLLGKELKAQMMFTDPPYGINYDGGHFHSGDVDVKRPREKLAGDDTPLLYGRFIPLMPKFVDGPCYTWFAFAKARHIVEAVEAVEAVGEMHALIIWHKTNATYAAMNAQYKQRHEPCIYWKPKGSTLRWIGPTDEHTVWEMKRDGRNDLHPTQKPVALAARAIGNHDAETVLDVFAGSGSTLIAAEQLKRRCFAMEINEHYCGVIIERWEKLTGKTAKLQKVSG